MTVSALNDALLAQSRREQRVRQLPRTRSHLAERDAFALSGNKVPVEALFISE